VTSLPPKDRQAVLISQLVMPLHASQVFFPEASPNGNQLDKYFSFLFLRKYCHFIIIRRKAGGKASSIYLVPPLWCLDEEDQGVIHRDTIAEGFQSKELIIPYSEFFPKLVAMFHNQSEKEFCLDLILFILVAPITEWLIL
jgi:hypothetical protein